MAIKPEPSMASRSRLRLLRWTELALEVLISVAGWVAAVVVFGLIGPRDLLVALNNNIGLALLVFVLIFAAAGFTIRLAFLAASSFADR